MFPPFRMYFLRSISDPATSPFSYITSSLDILIIALAAITGFFLASIWMSTVVFKVKRDYFPSNLFGWLSALVVGVVCGVIAEYAAVQSGASVFVSAAVFLAGGLLGYLFIGATLGKYFFGIDYSSSVLMLGCNLVCGGVIMWASILMLMAFKPAGSLYPMTASASYSKTSSNSIVPALEDPETQYVKQDETARMSEAKIDKLYDRINALEDELARVERSQLESERDFYKERYYESRSRYPDYPEPRVVRYYNSYCEDLDSYPILSGQTPSLLPDILDERALGDTVRMPYVDIQSKE